jgi:hypothetical protein
MVSLSLAYVMTITEDHMKTRLLLVLVVSCLASVALAASVHLKGGKNAEPAFNDMGLWLAAAGELSGLGNGDVLIAMEATANVTSTCTNQGGNAAPGQNPAPITVLGATAIPGSEVKNGNTPFTVATVPPDPVIPGAPDCPNPNWTESIDDLAFTSAIINVEQAGIFVLEISCLIDPESSDGAIGKRDVTCSQTQP